MTTLLLHFASRLEVFTAISEAGILSLVLTECACRVHQLAVIWLFFAIFHLLPFS